MRKVEIPADITRWLPSPVRPFSVHNQDVSANESVRMNARETRGAFPRCKTSCKESIFIKRGLSWAQCANSDEPTKARRGGRPSRCGLRAAETTGRAASPNVKSSGK